MSDVEPEVAPKAEEDQALELLHARGLRFIVEREVLPGDRAPTAAEVHAAIERRNAYWINEDFDAGQRLNGDLVDAELALLFVGLLPSQPEATLALLREKGPVDLASPGLPLRRGLEGSAASLSGPWQLVEEWGAFRLVQERPAFDLAHALALLAVATHEEQSRQRALDTHDAVIAAQSAGRTSSSSLSAEEAALASARESIWRGLIAVQQCRLTISNALVTHLEASPDPAAPSAPTVASLRVEIARLDEALHDAPAWGTRLPPPP